MKYPTYMYTLFIFLLHLIIVNSDQRIRVDIHGEEMIWSVNYDTFDTTNTHTSETFQNIHQACINNIHQDCESITWNTLLEYKMYYDLAKSVHFPAEILADNLGTNGNIHILKMSPSLSVSFENLTFMVDKTDSHVGLSLLESSSHETETLDVLLSVIEEGDVVIDVGANIGTMTLPLMRAVGKLGKVYAFEPQAHLAHLLAASVALNTGGNVGIFAESLELSQQIVSNTGGVSVSAPVMSYGEDEKLHNYAEQSFLHYLSADDPLPGEITSIITTTIDDIWFESRNDDDSGPSSRYIEENLSLKCPSVLKIDVERMEYLVLRGSKHLIKQCLPLLNVESWHELSKETLIEMCTSLGYSSIWDHSFTVTLFSPFSDKNHILVNPTRNTICIPPARALSYERHRRLHDLIDKEVRRGRMVQLYGP